MLPLVSEINSRLSPVNHELISSIVPHPVLWVALPSSVPSTHYFHYPSSLHSFTSGLKPSFSVNPSHHSLPFFQNWLHGLPRLFTVTPIVSYKRVRKIAHAQKRNPLSDLYQILHAGRYPRHYHRRKFWLRSVKRFSGGGDRLSPSRIGFIVALTTPSHYRASVWYKRLLSAVYDTQYMTAMHFHLSCRRYTCVPFIFSSAALSLSLDSWQCCIMPSSHQRNKSVSSRRVWRCELRRRRRRTAAET